MMRVMHRMVQGRAEVEEIEKRWQQRANEKEKRRKEQKANVEKKKKERAGSGAHNKKDGDEADEMDVDGNNSDLFEDMLDEDEFDSEDLDGDAEDAVNAAIDARMKEDGMEDDE